jgi:hypothetical protein
MGKRDAGRYVEVTVPVTVRVAVGGSVDEALEGAWFVVESLGDAGEALGYSEGCEVEAWTVGADIRLVHGARVEVLA